MFTRKTLKNALRLPCEHLYLLLRSSVLIPKKLRTTRSPFRAETMGFEPMCRLPDNLISSQARYGHFDTSPEH